MGNAHHSMIARKFCCSCLLLLLLFPAAAHALSVIRPTFAELVDEADRVVVGEALSSTCEWRTNSAGRLIFTVVQFRVAEVLKGQPTNAMKLAFLGGTVGPRTLEVSGMPQFVVGKSYILFVSPNRQEACPLIGAYHGQFHLRRDEKGGDETITHHDGTPVHIEPTAIANTTSKTTMLRNLTTAEFKQRIRDHVVGSKKARSK